MSWASKRQLIYLSIFIAVLAIIGALIIVPIVNVPPSCTDGKQNGGEAGVDCGGPCQIFCASQVSDAKVLWARAFHVAGDRYNVMAYLENQNPTAEIKDIGYEFRLYDADNTFITLRDGRTNIPPNGRVAIFEPGINVGNKIPQTTLFKFTDAPVWTKADAQAETKVALTVTDKNLTQTDSIPRLTATVANNTIYNVSGALFTAIVYDGNGNAVGASKTLASIAKNSKQDIFFTWTEPFKGSVFTTEIIPQFNPDTVTF